MFTNLHQDVVQSVDNVSSNLAHPISFSHLRLWLEQADPCPLLGFMDVPAHAMLHVFDAAGRSDVTDTVRQCADLSSPPNKATITPTPCV
jgi:hypothetical protein